MDSSESNALYTALPSDDTVKSDDIDSRATERQIPDAVAIEVIHDKFDTRSDLPLSRPRYSRENLVIAGSVTRHEQDMIHLISSFSATYTTEAGKNFVDHLCRLTDIEDFNRVESKSWGDPTRIIMWPTHKPDHLENFDGDFCSDVNWTFAYCHKETRETNPGGVLDDFRSIEIAPISATIIGYLHPLIPSACYSKLHAKILIEKPEKFLKPKGEILRSAVALCDVLRGKMMLLRCCGGCIVFVVYISVVLFLCNL